MTPPQFARLRKLAAIRRQRAEAELASSLARHRSITAESLALSHPPGTGLPDQGSVDAAAFHLAGLRETWRERKRRDLADALEQIEVVLSERRSTLSVALGRETALTEIEKEQESKARKTAQRRADDAPPVQRRRPWE